MKSVGDADMDVAHFSLELLDPQLSAPRSCLEVFHRRRRVVEEQDHLRSVIALALYVEGPPVEVG